MKRIIIVVGGRDGVSHSPLTNRLSVKEEVDERVDLSYKIFTLFFSSDRKECRMGRSSGTFDMGVAIEEAMPWDLTQ